jgi:hypothetical protein
LKFCDEEEEEFLFVREERKALRSCRADEEPKTEEVNLTEFCGQLSQHLVRAKQSFFFLFSFFLFGEISPNFDLKNMISTYTKDFP